MIFRLPSPRFFRKMRGDFAPAAAICSAARRRWRAWRSPRPRAGEFAGEFMLRRHDKPVQIELKRRLAEVLEEQVGDMPGRIVGRLIVLLILVNLIAVTLESVPHLAARYGMLFSTIEVASLLVFTVDYLARIRVAGF